MDDITKGYPRIAEKVALIDFDGTLYPFGHMFDFPQPLPGAVEAIQALKKKGYTIIIFTSRLSEVWLLHMGHEAWEHRTYIDVICKRDGIFYDYATAEKLPAEVYIDDRAITYNNNWDEIRRRYEEH